MPDCGCASRVNVRRVTIEVKKKRKIVETMPPQPIKMDSVRRWLASGQFQQRYWFCCCGGCGCCCCCCCCGDCWDCCCCDDCWDCGCWWLGDELDCGCEPWVCDCILPCCEVALPSLREREPPSWLLPRPARGPGPPAIPLPGAPDCITVERILRCADCKLKQKFVTIFLNIYCITYKIFSSVYFVNKN